MLYTVAPRLDAFADVEPIDEIKKRKFPIAPHSERNAFIGDGYWFFWIKPVTLSISLVKSV